MRGRGVNSLAIKQICKFPVCIEERRQRLNFNEKNRRESSKKWLQNCKTYIIIDYVRLFLEFNHARIVACVFACTTMKQ